MATSSRKASRIYFRSKEATAGTADTYANFEARSMVVEFPDPTYLREADRGKLGSGQFGTQSELQAMFCPVTFKASRLSEVAFLMAYALGTEDTVLTIKSGVYSHKLIHLAVGTRTLPTFTFEYMGANVAACDRFNHCIINDFQLTFAKGGNGLVDFTANGFANLHYSNAGALARNATVDNTLFSGANTAAIASEPLMNYKALSLWKGTVESTPLVQANISFAGLDLTAETALTAALDQIAVTFNNGITGEELLRCGGYGVLNNQERTDPSIAVELQLRKDTDVDALALADTQFAVELQWLGHAIGVNPERYAMDIFFPVCQVASAKQDSGSPIVQTVPLEVFQDSSAVAMDTYVQSAISGGYNATLT